jgi:hypothetical protein
MTLQHLLNGVAIAAAHAIAGPVWAQNNPSGGGYPTPAPAPSATPAERHAASHATAMHAHHKYMASKAALTGGTTARLNRGELARIQSQPPTAEQKQTSQLREDQAKKQQQFRNMYDMFRGR